MAESQIQFSDLKRLKFFKQDEIARAVASKLIHDSRNRQLNGQDGKRRPDDGSLKAITDKTASNIEDASAIFQVLPDIKIAMDIWVSSILSPKDFISENLIWSTGNNHDYNAQLFRDMTDCLRQYFTDEYDLAGHLRPAVEDALFKTGSYPLVIVPESSVDDIINGKTIVSNESLKEKYFSKNQEGYSFESIGVLGNPAKINNASKHVGIESYIKNSTNRSTVAIDPIPIHSGVTVTDNPDALKMSLLVKQLRKNNERRHIRHRYGMEKYSLSLEEITREYQEGKSHLSDELINKDKDKEATKQLDEKLKFDTKFQQSTVQNLYQTRAYSEQGVVTLRSGRDASRLPVGHPLVMKIPSSSIVPVHVPGDPSDIVGAFIMLDEFGNPLDSTKTVDLFSDGQNKPGSSDTQMSQARAIIKQMNFYTEGCCSGGDDKQTTLNDLARVYSSLFEQDLISRLANGIYGKNVTISHVEEVYRIMFSRALGAMRTQILYVPIELLTYFAFDYNAYGVGKSLLQDARTLAAMRVSLLYADIFGSIQNSIGRRKLMVTIDEDDNDPEGTLNYARTEYNRVNAFNIPLINQNPTDVINQLRESNVDVVIQGGNPAIPNTAIDVEDYNLNRTIPEENTQDKLKKYFATILGIPASFLDSTEAAQFAVTEVNSHILFNKQVITYQKIFSERFAWDHVSKYTLNDGTLIKRLSFIIKENIELLTEEQRGKGDTLEIIEDFLNALKIELPHLESTKLEDQKKDFDTYKDLVDNMLDEVYNDDILSMLLPESLREDSSKVRSIFKAILFNKYTTDNQFLPVLNQYLDQEDKDNVIKTEIKALFEPFARAAAESVLEFDRISKVVNSPELAKASEEMEDTGYGSSDSSDDSSSGDDFGGGDDFSFDGGFSGDEGGSETSESTEESGNVEEGSSDNQEDILSGF